jgi:hypothetical protein
MFLIFIFPGFQFYIPIYELVYRRLRGAKNENRIMATLVAGGLAGRKFTKLILKKFFITILGIAGWNSILPWDVVKNRMQVSERKKNLKII